MSTSKHWREGLIIKDDGSGLKPFSIQNALLTLRHAGIAKFTMSEDGKSVSTKEPTDWKPEPGTLTNHDYVAIVGVLEYYGVKVRLSDIKRIVAAVATHD